MVNLQGAKKKFPDKESLWATIYISEGFKEWWKGLKKMAEIDNDPEFLEYCANAKEDDPTTRKKGRRGMYIRWILAKHVKDNLQKVVQEAS